MRFTPLFSVQIVRALAGFHGQDARAIGTCRALTNYSKSLAKEFSSKGIRINSVPPGYTETDAAVGMVNEIAERTGISADAARQRMMDALGGIPLERPNRPEEVAALVAFLAPIVPRQLLAANM